MLTDGYADIHSHVLFGVDDGAASLDESLEMLALARREGIRTLFATPHYGIENGYAPKIEDVTRNFEALKAQAALKFPDMRLFLGSELFYAPGRIEVRVETGKARTMAGSGYIMAEFMEWGGQHEKADYICDSMIALAKSGWLPILAHAERYRDFRGKQQLYREMVQSGVYLQINAYDLADQPDEWVKANTRWLAQNRLAHFLGTDAHGVSKRPPVMRSGVVYLYRHCDEGYAEALVRGNAEKLIAGERVPLFFSPGKA